MSMHASAPRGVLSDTRRAMSSDAWSDESSLAELDALVAKSLPNLPESDLPEPGVHDPAPLEDLESELRDRRSVPVRAADGGNQTDDQATRLRRIALQSPPVQAKRHVEALTPEAAGMRGLPGDVGTATHRARVVVVASGKGGVGKTTLSVNLCVALAATGLRVTLLDADFGTANADVLCGLAPVARLDHVFIPGAGGAKWGGASPVSIRQIAVNAPGNFRLIPGSTGVSRMADLSPSDRGAIVRALSDLDRDTDVLIVDAGAGVGQSVTAFMAAADLSVVVATPEPTSIADAYALIKCAVADAGAEARLLTPGRVGIVLNQVLDGAESARVHARLRAVCDRFLGLDCALLGSIAQDLRVAQSVRAREPLLVRSPSAEASVQIKTVAAAISRQLGLRSLGGPASAGISVAKGEGVRGLVRRLLGT